MPRTGRWVLPDVPLHIVQRGINREPCFFSDLDYQTYLQYLGVSAKKFGCEVHAYCLMTNHVHLLVTPGSRESCGQMMKHLGQRYVQTVNQRRSRTGTLWEGRFRSCAVNSEEYIVACYRYIELNPVRAGMVAVPGDYAWSSYASNAGGIPDNLLTTHPAYRSLGVNDVERIKNYADLCQCALPQDRIDAIRSATRVGGVAGAARRKKGRPSVGQMRKMGSVPI